MRMLILLACLLLTSTPSVYANDSLPLSEVAPGVYVHQGMHEDLDEGYHGDISNIGFIIGQRGIAVIDTGGSLKVGQSLRASIKAISPLPILYVINTHVHPDHIFGNTAFLQDAPTFIGHAKLPEAMERRKESYLRNNQLWLGADFAGSEIIKPDQTVAQTSSIDLGGRVLTLHAYPAAHTTTDITVMDDKTGTLWTGDLLFIERTPSIDGDIKGWIEVIDTLKQTGAKLAIPGHGKPTPDLTTALNNEQRYLNTLLQDIRTSIKKGEVMEKAMDTAAASEHGKWVLFDIINRRNVNLLYPALEWE